MDNMVELGDRLTSTIQNMSVDKEAGQNDLDQPKANNLASLMATKTLVNSPADFLQNISRQVRSMCSARQRPYIT